VLDSALPDEEWVAATLRGYFPAELGQRFGEHLTDHPLRREIATTVLVNHVVGTGGLTFAFRAAEETGSDPADVVRAFVVASQVFGLGERAAAVEALDGQVEAYAQSRMRQAHQRLLDRSVRWLLHTRPEGIDVPVEIARFAPAVARLAGSIVELDDTATLQAEAEWFTERGVPQDEALRTVALLSLFPLLDVVEVADAGGRSVEEIVAVWYELSRRYAITTVLEGIAALPRGDRWQSLARAALRDDLYSAVRDFTAAVVAEVPEGARVDAAAAVQAWETAHAPAVRRAQQTMTDLEGEPGAGDLAALSVGLRALRTVLRAG
jgi:glutamate dehydrogenase